ncbi:hypothetical protein VSH64_46165 [Amycolatopsis rhabdoformis]|uniref:DUF4878 domain-containing protein n=1 Tax=Amycolatopsis rhabdoformis TaxID=1448059 RepID=A0ABZ1I9K3_9PSEU|nr:hypothetical protein [Amycolatopsis rhabdoformis]WSE30100.1 hypothetical protein VSH64_46165 [Amycolatopsis rhabdoformis]
MLSRRNATVGVAVGVGVAWVVAITVLIGNQPDPGSPTPAGLRDSLRSALTARDSSALEDLLNYPGSGASDFADDYVAVLGDEDARDIAVQLVPDDHDPTRAVVTGLARGARFTYSLAVTREEGRWTVAFTPPLP